MSLSNQPEPKEIGQSPLESGRLKGEDNDGGGGGNNGDGRRIPAIVFGASGEEGRAVVEGLLEANNNFEPVYGFTSQSKNSYLTDALGCRLWTGTIENPDDVRQALSQTGAQCIYLITTTDLTPASSKDEETSGFADAAAAEFEVMMDFAHVLADVHKQDSSISRHLIVSVRDDVQSKNKHILETTGETWIQPLDDGTVVPHYSAKGKGGKYIMEYLEKMAPEIKVTLLTMPFFYSNFLGFFCPLPTDETKAQWTLTACLGDGQQKIDMMGARDLKAIVPKIFFNGDKFHGNNLRLVGQQLSMDEIAHEFADLFGKDVIYNPLTYNEMAELPFPAAAPMAQMCKFLSSQQSSPQDLELCQKLVYPKHTQTFQDWLLVHSDSKAFEQVGLEGDTTEITSVTVFGGTSKEGISVIKGLLADVRKNYRVRATTRHPDAPAAKALLDLAPKNGKGATVELAFADYDDKESCAKALHGVDGAFLLTHLGHQGNQVMAVEERHVHNIIDACEAAHSVRHLVLASMMPANDPRHEHHHHTWNDEGILTDNTSIELPLDAKAMAAAYARTKKISVTYITLPYTEQTTEELKAMVKEEDQDDFRTILAQDGIVATLSVQELGPIVANIFDSYLVYAGHELALITEVTAFAGKSMDVGGAADDEDDDQDQAMAHGDSVVVAVEPQLQVQGTYVKDIGPMFTELAHSDAVKKRQPIARRLKLVPSSRPLKEWVELHEEDASFREKLGLS